MRRWNRETVIDACREWHAKYGTPPRCEDWEGQRGAWPAKTTVQNWFGTWNHMVELAGFTPRESREACLVWTAEKILDTLRAFGAEHGRPPYADEWRAATPTTPNAFTLARRFGSWNAALEAAGLTPRRAGSPVRWTKDAIANAMLDWLLVNGRWPTCKDWAPGTANEKHPTQSTVLRRFGTWKAAKRYAGWSPESRVKLRVVNAQCAGCGADMDCRTIGCKTCWDRHRRRNKWKTDPEFCRTESCKRRERRLRAERGPAHPLGTVGEAGAGPSLLSEEAA